jgi:hypothetical protein
MDVFISILTNGKVTRDNVGPHKELLVRFPYLGPPHKRRSGAPGDAIRGARDIDRYEGVVDTIV